MNSSSLGRRNFRNFQIKLVILNTVLTVSGLYIDKNELIVPKTEASLMRVPDVPAYRQMDVKADFIDDYIAASNDYEEPPIKELEILTSRPNEFSLTENIITKRGYFNKQPYRSVCFCGKKVNAIDLGHHAFPRYMTIHNCTDKFCHYGRKCTEITEKRLFLKKRSEYEVDSEPEIITYAPRELRGKWKVQSITVPVDCQCI